MTKSHIVPQNARQAPQQASRLRLHLAESEIRIREKHYKFVSRSLASQSPQMHLSNA